MVAYLPTRMAQGAMAAAAVAVYTVPVGKTAIVKQVIVANVGAVTVSAFVSLVPGGGAGAVGNRIVHDVDVPPKSVLTFELSQVLPAGGSVAAHASSAAALTLTVSGLEF